ncbi:MAG: omptin family outer membrane protease [Kiritimatiellae bacterium]|nr:omptin family outer membrane protease [Kiritimatiellia bacterium]
MKKSVFACMFGFVVVMSCLTVARGQAKGSFLRSTDEGSMMDFDVGLEGWGGDLTYRIGGAVVFPDGSTESVPFPLSELEFPVEVLLVSGQASTEIEGLWRASVRGAVSLSDDAGTMYNSDWGVLTQSGELDIFSESSAELDVWEVEAWLGVVVARGSYGVLALGAGYLYQSFDYVMSDLDQWYPASSGRIPPDRVSGTVATYEATVDMPYVGVEWSWIVDPLLRFDLRAGFSPYTQVEDEDHHLLRSKVSLSEDDGTGFLVQASARYPFTHGWYANASVRYVGIDVDGDQVQYQDGALLGQIEHEVDSEQVMARLGVGRFF